MNAAHLVRLNVEIENTITPDGDLLPLPGKESTLLAVSSTASGRLTYFRADLPMEIRRQILALDSQLLLEEPERVGDVLECYTLKGVFSGIGCYFARTPTPDEYLDVVSYRGGFAVMSGGIAASRAWTPDESDQAAELAIETEPGFRGRGYARQTAAAWAAEVIRTGKIAFYSYKVSNLPSAALARSLGVVQYARFTTYF